MDKTPTAPAPRAPRQGCIYTGYENGIVCRGDMPHYEPRKDSFKNRWDINVRHSFEN